MITDEQVMKALDAYYGIEHVGGARFNLISTMRNALEAYEQSKPKPEPVAYTSRGELEDLFYQAEMKAFSDKSDIHDIPLYTAPPTREPLSEDEAWEMWANIKGGNVSKAVHAFARSVEQAHGIGVTND